MTEKKKLTSLGRAFLLIETLTPHVATGISAPNVCRDMDALAAEGMAQKLDSGRWALTARPLRAYRAYDIALRNQQQRQADSNTISTPGPTGYWRGNMSETLYTFYCAFESATQLPDFTWEEDNQHVTRHFEARAAARDFAKEYHIDETDENRVVVFIAQSFLRFIMVK